MKLLVTLLLTLSLFAASTAHASMRMMRCGSDRHSIYYCSPILSGYRVDTITVFVKGASAAVYTCSNTRTISWFSLRRGSNRVWAKGNCYYWAVRQPR